MWICKCGTVKKSTFGRTIFFSSIINSDIEALLKFHSLEKDIQNNEGSFFFFFLSPARKILKGLEFLFKNKLYSMAFKNILYKVKNVS